MEISFIGWIHTILGTLAIFVAVFIIATKGFISAKNLLGKFYLVATAITAATALMLYQNGGFNLAHLLAVFTLIAILLGLASEEYNIFGFSKYIQAMSYTGSILFHLIPGIAEVNKRLPLDNPMGLSVDDPINICYYLIFTIVCGVTILIQWIYIWKNKA
tara:strand:+ start:872 stop:1351 length:480 start_codon:yes stop_codon:yes gene_type:complete